MNKLKYGKYRKIQWTKVAEQFIKKNYLTMTTKQMADAFGIKVHSCREKMYSMGLYKQDNKYWTEEEITFLLENYRSMGDTEIGKHLSRTSKMVAKKRGYLNIHRTAAELKSINDRNIENGCYTTEKAVEARNNPENHKKRANSIRNLWQKEKRRELSGLPLQTKLIGKNDVNKRPVLMIVDGQKIYCHSVQEAAIHLGKSKAAVSSYLNKGRKPFGINLKIKYASEIRDVKTLKTEAYLAENDFNFY